MGRTTESTRTGEISAISIFDPLKLVFSWFFYIVRFIVVSFTKFILKIDHWRRVRDAICAWTRECKICCLGPRTLSFESLRIFLHTTSWLDYTAFQLWHTYACITYTIHSDTHTYYISKHSYCFVWSLPADCSRADVEKKGLVFVLKIMYYMNCFTS